MKRSKKVSIILATAASTLASFAWSAEDESGPVLAAARSVVRPGIKRVGPVRITGQIKKGLSKADARKLTVPREDSRRMRIPRARVHTVDESAAVLRKIKGGQAFLKSVPIPRSGKLPDNASLLMTPLKPNDPMDGVKGAGLRINGVTMSWDNSSLKESAAQDRACVMDEEHGGAVVVCLSGMDPGWYIVAGDFVARSDTTYGLRGDWWSQEEQTGGTIEISSTLKRGSELFLPVMFQVTKSDSGTFVWFHPSGGSIFFRSASVQKLN